MTAKAIFVGAFLKAFGALFLAACIAHGGFFFASGGADSLARGSRVDVGDDDLVALLLCLKLGFRRFFLGRLGLRLQIIKALLFGRGLHAAFFVSPRPFGFMLVPILAVLL